MKTVGLRIRVEPELRKAFVDACKEKDLSAAQVLRTYMKSYINQTDINQPDLFIAESHANYESIEKD